MAAVFPTLGAVEHYIRPYSGGSWLYLGTAVQSPECEDEDAKLPLMSDLGGRSVPLSYVTDRRKSIVTTTLGRFNRTTIRFLRNEGVTAPNVGFYSEAAALNGFDNANTAFELLLINSFVASGVTQTSDQPLGRLYYYAIPRKFRENRNATRALEYSILFECISVFDPALRLFELYTEDPTQWGTVTPE